MKYPKFLKENGTIGFVAPSFGCSFDPYKAAFINAQKKFEELGHTFDFGPNCYEAKGIGISNTPQLCGKELTDYYCSVDNDILISCGGGEMMCETVNHIDFEKIGQAEPKWYMGYSDNTNFTFLVTTICDVASIYGPCAQTFGMEPWDISLQDTYDLLLGKKHIVEGYDMWEKESLKDAEHPFVPYNLTEKTILHNFPDGKTRDCEKEIRMEGRLLGGCVDCLIKLLGTQFDHVKEFNKRYKEDGIIWYLECCEMNVMDIRRAMWQLKNAGWFETAKGFVFGRPMIFGQEMMGLDQYHAVTDIIGDLNVPIIMDTDIGHIAPMMPIVNGSYGIVTAKGNHISIDMQWK